MNAENFSTYLAQPAKLYQLPYQEIKNLVAEYPYSANLRRLLLLKSKIEQDPKFEQYLHDLASSTLDRRHLYEFVTNQIPQLLDLETEPEERLELQDLTLMREKDTILVNPELEEQSPSLQADVIEPALEIEETVVSPLDEGNAVLPPIETADSSIIFEFDPVSLKPEPAKAETTVDAALNTIEEAHSTAITPTAESSSLPELPPEQLPSKDYRLPSHLLDTLIVGSLLSIDEHQPQPKVHFQSWQKRHKKSTRNWKSLWRSPATPSASSRTREIAKQSIQDPTNLASETLAKLLTRQGQYRKAIKIYQRLSLLYPEKSRYFAATIEELKQKI